MTPRADASEHRVWSQELWKTIPKQQGWVLIWKLPMCPGFPHGSVGKESTCPLFIIARTWKQPRCLSADEWIRRLWYIYTMGYYSAIRKDEIMLFTGPRDYHTKGSKFSSVQSLSRVRLFATPSIAAHQASLYLTNSWSLPKLMSIESVIPSNHLILCCPLLLLPSIFPSIRVFSNESAFYIRRTKY